MNGSGTFEYICVCTGGNGIEKVKDKRGEGKRAL